MTQSRDKEAQRLGVPREAISKVWIVERLKVDAHALKFNVDADVNHVVSGPIVIHVWVVFKLVADI